ncbi:MAG: hypothetical protein K1060chlam4_00278 [Candidatus Anoxychlamydiales bacterium]|nr:hypothetical protein [Candidatus Anoxychlamydiales bacterium]
MLNGIGNLNNVFSSLNVQNHNTNLKHVRLIIGASVVPFLALLILASIPKASAGLTTFGACMAKCVGTGIPVAICTGICAPFIGPYCP